MNYNDFINKHASKTNLYYFNEVQQIITLNIKKFVWLFKTAKHLTTCIKG